MTGLHYQIMVRRRMPGRGCKTTHEDVRNIAYVQTDSEKRIRVETCLVPLREISEKLGDKIRLCYYGYSPSAKVLCHIGRNGTRRTRVAVSWQVPA